MRDRRPATELDPVVEFEDIESFAECKTIPFGRFSILYNGIPVDCFYEPIEGANTTIVFFHGAVQSTIQWPWHPGKTVMQGLNAHRFSVSDPTLTLCENLTLAWYVGNEQQPDLQRFVERIIRLVTEKTGKPHMIFTGGSGGGFAALEMSRRFPGSLAMPMNPQTSVGNYNLSSVNRYLRAAWPEAKTVDDIPATGLHNLVETYTPSLKNTIAYVQNTRDVKHIERHQRPLFDKVGKNEDLWVYMWPWGDPAKTRHVAPPREVTALLLSRFIECSGLWQAGLRANEFDNDIDEGHLARHINKANAVYVQRLEKS